MENTKQRIIKKNCGYNINKLFGTGLRGYINLNYKELVSVFGKTNGFIKDYKVDWSWTFLLNQIIITIYNYKTGPSYLHKRIGPNSINIWHVGAIYYYDLKILEDYIIQKTGDKFSGRVIIEEA